MTSTSGNRASFISQLKQFMDTYGFDGVDLDWEYPQADDRGGQSGDTANYVSLVKEMRASFGSKYGITVTLPTSFWYLQHFDLPGMQSSIDWFNLMSYDRMHKYLCSFNYANIVQCTASGMLNHDLLDHTSHLTQTSVRSILVLIYFGELVLLLIKSLLVRVGYVLDLHIF
jgi:hypothetical protein